MPKQHQHWHRFATLVLFPALFVVAGCDPGDVVVDGAERPRLRLIAESPGTLPTVTSAIVLRSDSTACVVDSYESRVVCGGHDWSAPVMVGRAGDGPGEFRRPSRMIAGDGGRLGVVDGTRITILTAEDSLLHTTTSPQFLSPLMLDGDQIVGVHINPSGAGQGPALHRLALGDQANRFERFDPPPPLGVGGAAIIRAGTAAFGDEFVFWTGGYELVRYGPDGVVRGVITAPSRPPELPTELDAEILVEAIRVTMGATVDAARLEAFASIPKLPLIRDWAPLRAEGAERLWAATSRDNATSSYLEVFDRTGWVGTVRIPDRLMAFDIRGRVLAAHVLEPASEPDAPHTHRIRWYEIEG